MSPALWTSIAGTSAPTVVFLPGAGSIGLEYDRYQRELSELTTVLYDRAGTGFSDAVPLPRDPADVTAELRALIADLPAPYILVGHSLGGAYAQHAAAHLPDVAGLVLLDPVHRDWNRAMPAELQIGPAASAQYTIDDIDLPAHRASLEHLLAMEPADIRERIIAVRTRADRALTGMAEAGNFFELLDLLPAADDLPPTVIPHATAIDPAQAQYRSEALLQAQIDAMREMYIADFGSAAYVAVPEATHSSLPFVAHDLVCDSVRRLAQPH